MPLLLCAKQIYHMEGMERYEHILTKFATLSMLRYSKVILTKRANAG